MSVSYTLGNFSKKEKKYTIRLRYRRNDVNFIWDVEFNGEKLRVSESGWDKKKQKLKSGVIGSEDVNLYLQTIDNTLPLVIKELFLKGYSISKKSILELLFEKLDKSDEICESNNVGEYIKHFIERAEKGIMVNSRGKEFEKGSLRIYRRLQGYFELVYPNLTFNGITKKWFEEFFYVFLKDKQELTIKKNGIDIPFSKKALSDDTIQGILTRLSKIMRQAVEDGYSVNRNFEKSWFLRMIPKIDKKKDGRTDYALSELQLNELVNYVPHDEYGYSKVVLGQIRDLFLLGCYTSLRVSDLITLTKLDIEEYEDGYIIRKRRIKTDKWVVIPVVEEVPKKIIAKYMSSDFPSVSYDYINKGIKCIAKYLGWDEPIRSNRVVGGKKVELIQPLYEVISSHFGRRTAITNLLRNNLSLSEVQSITGHETSLMVELYDKRKEEERLNNIINKIKKQ